jgi:ATPase subunit of ABC transporter with duplicated ATPase domains
MIYNGENDPNGVSIKAKHAMTYLLDEPTSYLVTEAVFEIITILKNIPSKASVIVVSHDIDFLAQVCDDLYRLENCVLGPIDFANRKQ